MVDDLDYAVAHFQDGHVECTAAQVEDQDGLVLLLVQTVGQGSGGRFVDDALDFQAGDLAGILGGLALAVVEVGRDGDDRLGDRLTQIGFRIRFSLARIMAEISCGLYSRFGSTGSLTRASSAVLPRRIRDHLALVLDFFKAAPHERLME